MNVEPTPIAKALSVAKATTRMLKMLRHTSAGWEVRSEDGSKKLGGPYPSKDAAVARLTEVEGHKTQKDTGTTLSTGDLANAGELVPAQGAPASLLRRFNGIPLRIDRPKGFVQKGVAEDGTPWERTYKNDYGEIPDTAGGDGEALDVFLGDDDTAKDAHWVVQRKSDGNFDEYKMILGAPSADVAKAIYLAHVPEKHFGGMATTTVEMVKSLLGIHPAEVLKELAKSYAIDVVAKALDDATSEFARIVMEQVAMPLAPPPAPTTPTEKRDEGPSVNVRLLPVAKADAAPEQRFILGIVLEPETEDAQNEIYSADEIEKTAHRFLADYRNTDLQHKLLINPLVQIVESYIARADHVIGGQPVKAGTWLLAHKILDDELWGAIKRREFTGYSIKGFSNREPAPPT